jgi:hypothetical protein
MKSYNIVYLSKCDCFFIRQCNIKRLNYILKIPETNANAKNGLKQKGAETNLSDLHVILKRKLFFFSFFLFQT